MTRESRALRTSIIALIGVCVVVATSASAQVPDGKPQIRKRTSILSPLEAITKFKLRPDSVEPADFVKKTRPAEEQLQYVPVGSPRAEPEKAFMTFDQIRAMEAELDGSRSRHDTISGRGAPKVAFKPVAMEPKKPVAKKKPNCLITCTVETRVTRN